MPNKLKEGTKRVSYVESVTTHKALDILAAAKDSNMSAILREATESYLAKHDPNGELQKVAAVLRAKLSDDRTSRPEEEIDRETQAALARVVAKLRKE
jgi:hypothetical protein